MCNTRGYIQISNVIIFNTLTLQVDYTFILDGFRNIIRTFVTNSGKHLENIAVVRKTKLL